MTMTITFDIMADNNGKTRVVSKSNIFDDK